MAQLRTHPMVLRSDDVPAPRAAPPAAPPAPVVPVVDPPIDPGRAARGTDANSRMYLVSCGPEPNKYVVCGETGAATYAVTLDPANPLTASCTCPDRRQRHVVCKHLVWLATGLFHRRFVPGMTWTQLCGSTAAPPTAATVVLQPVHQRQLDELQAIVKRLLAAAPAWLPPRLDAASQCAICLDSIVPLPSDDKVHWCRYGCGGVVHASCGLHLLEPKCPYCRNPKFYGNPQRYGRR